MSFFAIGAGVAALTAAGIEAVSASKAADSAAAMGDYNAKVDISQAQQTAMDAQANIDAQREQDQTFMSGQRAAYAASGIISGTGSAMAVQATTAGRMEQNIQQYWQDQNAKINQDYASARVGIYQGQQQADIDHLEGASDIFSGIGSALSDFGKASSSGGSSGSGGGS